MLNLLLNKAPTLWLLLQGGHSKLHAEALRTKRMPFFWLPILISPIMVLHGHIILDGHVLIVAHVRVTSQKADNLVQLLFGVLYIVASIFNPLRVRPGMPPPPIRAVPLPPRMPALPSQLRCYIEGTSTFIINFIHTEGSMLKNVRANLAVGNTHCQVQRSASIRAAGAHCPSKAWMAQQQLADLSTIRKHSTVQRGAPATPQLVRQDTKGM
mmetsp:Transcript_34281/g.63951  ORF Transcript_34281/g.63951 Transcript_34281/m.63951 type:complete len:212 (-) Transcript_34281:571-1206(-)